MRGGGLVKVINKRVIEYENPEQVYDVVGATPNSNFLISDDNENFIVSHNCGLL